MAARSHTEQQVNLSRHKMYSQWRTQKLLKEGGQAVRLLRIGLPIFCKWQT